MGATGAGDSDDVVVYTVSYPWRLFTPLIGSFFGNDGIVTLTARSVVKNEPFLGSPRYTLCLASSATSAASPP